MSKYQHIIEGWTKEQIRAVLPAHYIFIQEHPLRVYQDAFDHWVTCQINDNPEWNFAI